jgi:hypothetical protein
MKIEDHLQKAERIDRSMQRLDRDEDYEMLLEACMLAGTHLLNAALHRAGITAVGADLLHSDKPPLDASVPGDIGRIMKALKPIEDLRPGYLRNVKAWQPADGDRCLRNLEEIRRLTEEALGRIGVQP